MRVLFELAIPRLSSKNSRLPAGLALGYRRLPRSRRRRQYRRIRRNGSGPWRFLEAVDLHFLVPFVFQDNIVQVDEFVDMT